MTILYGFELEGFFVGSDGGVKIPPRNYPVDGFPGLIEIRNSGGNASILKQLYGLFTKIDELKEYDNGMACFDRCEYTFSGDQMRELRRDRYFDKRNVDICNIYGKSPRRSGNKTLASFQISVSNQIREAYTLKEVNVSASYGLLDVYRIVRALDKEFEKEIKISKRQPGMYAIKGDYRLEYRSLPNFVVEDNSPRFLAERIKRAVEPSR